jgi:hypothetical protein
MGPFSFIRILPMTTNLPSIFNETNCRWPRIGPFSCTTKSADDHEWAHSLAKPADDLQWAHFHTWRKWAITTNGPNIVHEKSCRWPWMSSFFSIRRPAEDVQWGLSRAWRKLQMTTNGPNIVNETNCRQLWMHPFSHTEETIDDLEWAHCRTWGKLLMT